MTIRKRTATITLVTPILYLWSYNKCNNFDPLKRCRQTTQEHKPNVCTEKGERLIGNVIFTTQPVE